MNLEVVSGMEDAEGVMLEKGIMLETVTKRSGFDGINQKKFFIYDIDENVKMEINPRIEKYDIFKIYDCVPESTYVYYTVYDDQYDGTYSINLVRYDYKSNETDVIFSIIDDISFYPSKKRGKVFILNSSHLLFERITPRKQESQLKGLFDFKLILYDYVENKKVNVCEENFVLNGIDEVIPVDDKFCVVKTGYSLFEDYRLDYISKDDASVESIGLINREQLVSDLAIGSTSIVMETLERAYFNTTIPRISVNDGFVIYSVCNRESNDETVHFYNCRTKEQLVCVNKNVTSEKNLAKTYIIGGMPYVCLHSTKGTSLFNLADKNKDISIEKGKKLNYISTDICVVTGRRAVPFAGRKNFIEVTRTADPDEIIYQGKGDFLYALSFSGTHYIFTA